jgi:hypothetical protein
VKKIKIYLAWLSTGQREDIHLYQLDEWRNRYGEYVELVLPDMCTHMMFHDAARNNAVEEFLATDCDILWFLDSDIAPPPHILDLVVHHKDKWEVAGAPYPLWAPTPGSGELSILFTVYKGITQSSTSGGQRGIFYSELPDSGAEFVDGLATGCLFIKREVFSKVQRPFFEFKFHPETRRIQEGEDLGFALKCHDLGIKFFVDYGMVCRHFKRMNLLDMNNYALKLRNSAIKEYCDQVKPEIEAAYKAAYEAGIKKGKAEAKQSNIDSSLPNRTKAGLILPDHYRS